MNKRDFDRDLMQVCAGFFGGNDWRTSDGRTFTHLMDDLALNCNDEQWLIVDETCEWLRDPHHIVGEVPCSTPVSLNEWEQMTS